MAGKSMVLRYGGADVTVSVGSTIHREALYGKQSRSAEKNGRALVKVLLDPEGNVFDRSDFTPLQVDSRGSLAESPLVQAEDGTIMEPRPSSFKVTRELRDASLDEIAELRVDSVMPVQCQLPFGLYVTDFTYRDAPVLKTAILNVTEDGAFLLVGTRVDSPLQGPTDVYAFFDAGDEVEDEEDEDEIPFMMF